MSKSQRLRRRLRAQATSPLKDLWDQSEPLFPHEEARRPVPSREARYVSRFGHKHQFGHFD